MPPSRGIGKGKGPRRRQTNVTRVAAREVVPTLRRLTRPPRRLLLIEISAASGVSVRTISSLLNGQLKRVNRATAEALLNADYPEVGQVEPLRYVPATGTTRRLQALACSGGWVAVMLAEETGLSRNHLICVRRGQFPRVEAETAARVKEAYDRLWDRRCPAPNADQVRWHAERMGWAPPAAWDDDVIDDPKARPDGWKPALDEEQRASFLAWQARAS